MLRAAHGVKIASELSAISSGEGFFRVGVGGLGSRSSAPVWGMAEGGGNADVLVLQAAGLVPPNTAQLPPALALAFRGKLRQRRHSRPASPR